MRRLIAAAWLVPALPVRAHVADAASASSFEPWIAFTVAFAAVLYGAGLIHLWRRARVGRGVSARRAGLFVLALCVLAVSLLGPLDAWSATSFAAHMTQHEMLMLVAAPMLAASQPLAVFAWAFPANARRAFHAMTGSPAVRRLWTLLTSAVGATVLQLVVLWVWHAPRLFDLALEHRGVHALQHASFLAAALCFWWALRAPRGGDNALGRTLGCLFLTMIGSGGLGALLTFATTPWYAAYDHATSPFGLSALDEQQVGGLLMWIPGGTVFVVVALMRLWRALDPARDRMPPLLAPPRALR